MALGPARAGRFVSHVKCLCLVAGLSGALGALALPAENLLVGTAGEIWYPEGIALDLPLQDRLYEVADAALLLDVGSGEVLYARHATRAIPPASLTKLVTIALCMEHLKQQSIGLDQVVKISPRSWAVNAPPRSSLMFLGPEQDPTWNDLLLGLAVDSGNDAAIAVAEAVAGDVPAFVRRMNDLARRLGMNGTVFEEPSGYSERNMTSVRDFGTFLLWYLRMWPDNLARLHSVPEFTYPNKPGVKQIRQPNRNQLIHHYPGADGLKTGYIDESGYNLAFTAEREGYRLAGVILGGKNDKARTLEAGYLLDEGFARWQENWLEIPSHGGLRTFNAERGSTTVQGRTVRVLLPKDAWPQVQMRTTVANALVAPWDQAVPVGAVDLVGAKPQPLARIPLYLRQSLGAGNPVQALAEGIYLWAGQLAGQAMPLGEAEGRRQYGVPSRPASADGQ